MEQKKKGIVIAAPSSGSGKTTITISLIEALKERGLTVNSFKCGPDYIDPMFHRSVLGIESGNLDLFFTGEKEVRELFYRDNFADISIVEGVMGLYDGLGGVSEEASTYHLARTIGLPIILCINGRGMGRSILAELAGFLSFDRYKLIKGVILNCVSSMYYGKLKKLIEDNLKVKVLGYFPMDKSLKIESRHLGLTMPYENPEIIEGIKRAGKIFSESVSIDEIVELAGSVEIDSEKKPDDRACDEKTDKHVDRIDGEVYNKASNSHIRIAVARDEAFCFYYRENLRMLSDNGVELVYFSPIHDKELPENVSGLILGGGYPELFLKKLSQNKEMLSAIKSVVSGGLPSLAECGGFMYLHRELESKEGVSYAMADVIDGKCYYTGKLVRFGYINITDTRKVFLDDEATVSGHEFHYYDSTMNGSSLHCVKPVGKNSFDAGIISRNSWWGFAHLYYPSNPSFVKRFIEECKKFYTNNQGEKI